MAVRNVFVAQSVSVNAAPIQMKGSYQGSVHTATFMLRGTLAGARSKLRIGPAGDGPWQDIAESTLEGIGAINVDVANGFWLQAVLENTSVGTSCDGFFGGGVYTR